MTISGHSALAFVPMWGLRAVPAARMLAARAGRPLGVRSRSLAARAVVMQAGGSVDGDMFDADASFAALGVGEGLVGVLGSQGIGVPTRAQVAVVPRVLRGLEGQAKYAEEVRAADEADVRATEEAEAAEGEEGAVVVERPLPPADDVDDVLMVGAETGSGKTLAYLLPYVETLRRFPESKLKAVVLVPSRELCHQVARFLETYFPSAPRSIVLSGGRPPDVDDIKSVRVIISTPAALLNYFRFSQRGDTSDKYIVVDEADMLLSGSFLRDVERVLDQPGMKPFATRKNGPLRAMNRNRLLFIGATYPHWTGERVKSIVTWMRRRYPGIQSVQTDNIHKRSLLLKSQWRYAPTEQDRLDALTAILRDDTNASDKIMVFASKAEAIQSITSAVTVELGKELLDSKFGGAVQLHKHVAAKDRIVNLDRFRAGTSRLLLCTDLAARGLDLGDVTRVIEYEFSSNVVGYLHRIGRTARAGARGATDHFYDDVSKPLADAIRTRSEKQTTVVEGVFSRNRSFRRKLKKVAAGVAVEESNDSAVALADLEEDEMDEEEEARLRQ